MSTFNHILLGSLSLGVYNYLLATDQSLVVIIATGYIGVYHMTVLLWRLAGYE